MLVVVLALALLLVGACGGEEPATVGDDCIVKVGALMDVEYLEEHDASLVEIGAGRGDLIASIALACRDASPDDSVEEVAKEAVRILRPSPPPEEM